MRWIVWLSSLCLWPVAAFAGGETSAYSPFDLEKTCTPAAWDEVTGAPSVWSCPGYRGIEILQGVGDDRSFAGFGVGARESCAFSRTFAPFNEALSPVEWRLRNGKPFAVIERWRVAADDAGGSRTWLVVTALRDGDACPVHYVAGSYPRANEEARRVADDLAAGFDCVSGMPGYSSTIGPPPIALDACGTAGE